MHNRKRSTITPEMQSKMDRKAEMISDLMSVVLKDSRSKKDISPELLERTSKLLMMNPDCYTLWNYRREILIETLGERGLSNDLSSTDIEGKTVFSDLCGQRTEAVYLVSDAEGKAIRDQELLLTQQCIQKNPKSYPSWYHREWVVSRFQCIDQGLQEIELCNLFLKTDQRNFHCWNYRRFVVNHFNISANTEIEYSTAKIEENFSNYSAFHHRAVYLQGLISNIEQLVNFLRVDFGIIENAVFTDPYDQSAWWYWRYLIKQCAVILLEACDGSHKTAICELLAEQVGIVHEITLAEPECRWAVDSLLHLLIVVENFSDQLSAFGKGDEAENREGKGVEDVSPGQVLLLSLTDLGVDKQQLLEKVKTLDPLRAKRYDSLYKA